MKNFVAIVLVLVVCLGSYAFKERPVKPSGGYLPITEKPPVEVMAAPGGYQLKFPMDLWSDWNGTVEYQLVNWTLRYKPVGLSRNAYIPVPSGVFQPPPFGSKRANYNANVNWSPGTYDVEINVEEMFENSPVDGDLLHYTVTIP